MAASSPFPHATSNSVISWAEDVDMNRAPVWGFAADYHVPAEVSRPRIGAGTRILTG